MANNNTAAPAQKPPQTAGMSASAGLAGSKGNIKSYMEARGAKPVASTGTYAGSGKPPVKQPPQGGTKPGSYGNMAKQRRMQGAPISAANRVARGGNVNPPGGGARFQTQGGVPTGGRGLNGQMGQLSQRFGAGNGAGRGAAGRVQAFLDQRREQQGNSGGGNQTGPQGRGLGTALGANTAGPKNPGALSAARGALGQLQQGHSTRPPKPALKPGMPNVKPPQGGPVTGGTSTMQVPPSSRPPLLSGTGTGPKSGPVQGGGNAGGGGTIGPGRQRAKMM